MRTSGRAATFARQGRTKAGWLSALALAGLMALPTATAPLVHASGALAPTLYRPVQSFTVASNPVGVAFSDLNGDGIPDMVVGNDYDNSFQVRLGNGDGTFQPAVSYAYSDTSWYLVEPVIADFNGDGSPDVALASYDTDTVYVFLNDGHGHFAPDTAITGAANSGRAWGITAADINLDGKIDLIFTEYDAHQVDVALGHGNGSFGPPRAYVTGLEPSAVAVGDFNGDGKPDLAVTNWNDATVDVFMNTGYGYFHASHTYNVGSDSYGVVVADFNDDGMSDLAIATTANGLQILEGNSSGILTAWHSYGPHFGGAGDYALAKGDVNGDGMMDLIMGSDADDGLVNIWLGDGTGAFTYGGTFQTDANIWDIATADVNGDGKSDIAVSDYGDDDVHMLESALPPSATLAFGSPSKIRPNVNWVTAATPLTISLADQGDGVKRVAWRVYAVGATPPAYSVLNSTNKIVGLHGLQPGKYEIQYYGVSNHGFVGTPVTTYFTLVVTIP